jgi:hypothetical protein
MVGRSSKMGLAAAQAWLCCEHGREATALHEQ